MALERFQSRIIWPYVLLIASPEELGEFTFKGELSGISLEMDLGETTDFGDVIVKKVWEDVYKVSCDVGPMNGDRRVSLKISEFLDEFSEINGLGREERAYVVLPEDDDGEKLMEVLECLRRVPA